MTLYPLGAISGKIRLSDENIICLYLLIFYFMTKQTHV